MEELLSWFDENSNQLGTEMFTDPRAVLYSYLGNDYELEIDRFHHFELVGLHLGKALDLHSEGQVYKAINKDMYVLNDDFNDPLLHFCAASERLRINIGQVKGLQEKAMKKNEMSYLYKYKNYLPS